MNHQGSDDSWKDWPLLDSTLDMLQVQQRVARWWMTAKG